MLLNFLLHWPHCTHYNMVSFFDSSEFLHIACYFGKSWGDLNCIYLCLCQIAEDQWWVTTIPSQLEDFFGLCLFQHIFQNEDFVRTHVHHPMGWAELVDCINAWLDISFLCFLVDIIEQDLMFIFNGCFGLFLFRILLVVFGIGPILWELGHDDKNYGD